MTDLLKFAPESSLGSKQLVVTTDDVRSISAEWASIARREKSERGKSRRWEKIKNRVVR